MQLQESHSGRRCAHTPGVPADPGSNPGSATHRLCVLGPIINLSVPLLPLLGDSEN